jgi:hypothetical protein
MSRAAGVIAESSTWIGVLGQSEKAFCVNGKGVNDASGVGGEADRVPEADHRGTEIGSLWTHGQWQGRRLLGKPRPQMERRSAANTTLVGLDYSGALRSARPAVSRSLPRPRSPWAMCPVTAAGSQRSQRHADGDQCHQLLAVPTAKRRPLLLCRRRHLPPNGP